MRYVVAFLVIFFATTWVVSADVSISRELYTNTGEIYETTTLNNIEYKNDISISPFIVYESAEFAANGNVDSAIQSIINVQSSEGSFGSNVESEGLGLSGSRTAATGIANSVSFDHQLLNGELDASSYTTSSRTIEQAEFENGAYKSSIVATPEAIFHSGVGYGPLNQDYTTDAVSHNVELWHNGKYTDLNLQIDCLKDNDGIRPAFYSWAAAAGGQAGDSGVSQVAAGTSAGNSNMDVNIKGTSSELPPNHVSRHIYPLMLDDSIKDEDGDGEYEGLFDDPDFNQMIDLLLRAAVSQNLYMAYSIQ